jgi:DNA-binding HxlR family transcriptional regulator
MTLGGSPNGGRLPPPIPAVPLQACPINASLGTLGRKWTLTILRDIAFYPGTNFSSILKTNPGLRQRTLSLRLQQLVKDGLVGKRMTTNGGRRAHYDLTAKGREVWPILAGLVQFGVRNFATEVFADAKSRNIGEVFPGSAELMMGPLMEFARTAGSPPNGGANARKGPTAGSSTPSRRSAPHPRKEREAARNPGDPPSHSSGTTNQ